MKIERFTSEVVPLRRELLVRSVRFLGNAEDAEDAVQETLLRLWKIRDELSGIDRIKAFASRVLKNVCIDKLRARRETVDIESVLTEEAGTNPEEKVVNKNSYDIVGEIIKNLPELQRTIIRMRDIEDYELKEIAAITGTNVAAVAMNLSRARKRVREMYLKIHSYKMIGKGNGKY